MEISESNDNTTIVTTNKLQPHTLSDIEFTNILNKERDRATCNIIRVGDITMMFDCGCDEAITQQKLDIVVSYLEKVDFIFLSHSAFTQVGALPYAQSLGKLDHIKLMSTSPSAKMGALTMYELYIQKKEAQNFDLFKLQHVE